MIRLPFFQWAFFTMEPNLVIELTAAHRTLAFDANRASARLCFGTALADFTASGNNIQIRHANAKTGLDDAQCTIKVVSEFAEHDKYYMTVFTGSVYR